MGCTIVVGGLFGDEGKGKIIAYIAEKDDPSIIARGGVGPNAGHTVISGKESYGVRMVPSGFIYEPAKLMIGAGVLVNPDVLFDEMGKIGHRVRERLKVDMRCSIIEQKHIDEDKSDKRLKGKIGTTGTGCGPANVERVMRSALQAKDLEALAEFITDVPLEVNEAIDRGEFVILEGSQGFGISLFYGTYPYVTTKDTTASQIAADVGVGPTKIDEVIVVLKAFPTRVGEGPFRTEMSLEESEKLGIVEYGTVTKRRRRIGYWDGRFARYSAMLNSATSIAITGLDRVDSACRGVMDYDKLSDEVKEFVKKAEADVGVPFKLLSTGPGDKEIVDLR